MEGVYKFCGCTVLDPEVTVLTLTKDYQSGIATVEIDCYGQNVDPEIEEEDDGSLVEITDVDNPLPADDSEPSIKAWAEAYMQQYKQ